MFPLDEADLDGDGVINFLEFHDVMMKKNPSSKKSAPPTPPKPPDGGWGWFVVLACFFCNFVIGKRMTIHYARLKLDGKESKNSYIKMERGCDHLL